MVGSGCGGWWLVESSGCGFRKMQRILSSYKTYLNPMNVGIITIVCCLESCYCLGVSE